MKDQLLSSEGVDEYSSRRFAQIKCAQICAEFFVSRFKARIPRRSAVYSISVHQRELHFVFVDCYNRSLLSLSICLWLLLSPTTPSNAQQKVILTDVPGSWVISADITPMQAREKAIQQAKLEALRQAGVPERISESNILYKSEKKRDFQEIFKSIVTTSVSGDIAEYKVTKEEKRTDAYGGLIYSVILNCTVVIHSSKDDPSFNMEVTGIRETYQSPDQLRFDIKPSKDGFLTVFYLGDTTNDQIYPNRIERQEKLVGGQTYHFPRSKALEYEVSTKGSLEINYVVLLYTKHDIPFHGEQTTDSILQFLAAIDPGEKCVRNYTVTIKR
jgi:hypothetical protein